MKNVIKKKNKHKKNIKHSWRNIKQVKPDLNVLSNLIKKKERK